MSEEPQPQSKKQKMGEEAAEESRDKTSDGPGPEQTDTANINRQQERVGPHMAQEEDVDSKELSEGLLNPSTGRLRSMVERYFTRFFVVDTREGGREDQFVFFHSNRLCMIGLSPFHPLVSESPKIENIDFDLTRRGGDLRERKVSGKKKKGSAWMQPETKICKVSCERGRDFIIRSGVRGFLLEVNEKLTETATLLQTKPVSRGFVAILRPRLEEVKELMSTLVTYEEYKALRGLEDEAFQ